MMNYATSVLNEDRERTKTLDRQKLPEESTKKRNNRIPLLLTHHLILPNVKKTKTSICNLLHINQELKYVFQELPYNND